MAAHGRGRIARRSEERAALHRAGGAGLRWALGDARDRRYPNRGVGIDDGAVQGVRDCLVVGLAGAAETAERIDSAEPKKGEILGQPGQVT